MEGSFLTSLLPLILIFAIFYFLLIRPQQKRQKQRNAMLQALKKGDKVITIGGIHGTIVDITEERITLKVSDTTKMVLERSAVNAVQGEDSE